MEIFTYSLANQTNLHTSPDYLCVQDRKIIIFGVNAVCMEDNYLIYKCYCTLIWLQGARWKVADYPTCTLYLNPIMHVWGYLKKVLHQRFANLVFFPSGLESVKRKIAEC